MEYPKDVCDWQQLADNVDSLEELTVLEKNQAKQGFQYLRKALGEDFLRRIWVQVSPEGLPHPLMGLMINFAPWTRRELTRLSEALRILKGSENLEALIARLEDPKKFRHDELVIKSAAKLVTEGLLAGFEPTLPVAQNQKQPDIKLQNPETGETLFLEVAVQGSARSANEAYAAMNAVTFSLMRVGVGIQWAGRMLKTPAIPHWEEIARAVDKAIQRAQEEHILVDCCGRRYSRDRTLPN